MRWGIKHIPSNVKILSSFTLFFIILIPAIVNAEDVILTWNRPDDARVTGYEIFYGPAENDDFKSSPKEIISTPEQTNCNIKGLIAGQTYAFAAKSFDSFGNRSVFSEVIFYTLPVPPKDEDTNNNSDDKKKIDDSSEKNEQVHPKGGAGGGCFIRITR